MINAESSKISMPSRRGLNRTCAKNLEKNATNQFQNDAVEKLVEAASMEYPKLLVEHEIDHLVREATGNDQAQYQAYLRTIGRSEVDFRETWREAADLRLRRSLALSELAEAEGLDVTADEIEEEWIRSSRQWVTTRPGSAKCSRATRGCDDSAQPPSRKTLDRLSAIAKGELQEEPA